MKVYGKWLVMGTVNGHKRIASSFMTKKDAIETLEICGFKRLENNLWEDSLGQKFFIEKNTKEWR